MSRTVVDSNQFWEIAWASFRVKNQTFFIFKAFYAGNKYYFEIYIEKGSLIKIGVSRGDINFEEVWEFVKIC